MEQADRDLGCRRVGASVHVHESRIFEGGNSSPWPPCGQRQLPCLDAASRYSKGMASWKAWIPLFLGALTLLLWGSLSVWSFTVDDAYIIFRYAQNIAEGQGPTYNPGGPPVEGVTPTLWMCLLSLPAWLGIDLVFAAKCLGLLAMASTILVLIGGALARPGGLLAALFAALFFASFPPTIIHSVSGMGTALFTFQVTMHLWLTRMFLLQDSRVKASVLTLSALLLGLSRPDGNLISVISLVTVLLQTRDRSLLRASVVYYLIPSALYFIARWTYYGYLLPLPVYIKILGRGAVDPSVPSGFIEAMRFLEVWGLGLALPFLLGLFRLDRSFLPAVVSATTFLFTCLFPAQVMGFEWRFFFPLIPILLLITGIGVQGLFEWLCDKVHLPCLLAALVSLMLLLFPVFQNDRLWPATRATWLGYERGMERAHLALGERLRDYPGSQGLLVIGDAGAVPYVSRWETLDSFGLNEPSIATTGRHDALPILERDPALIVLISKSSTQMVSPLPWEKAIYDLALTRGYVHARALEFAPTYYLWLLTRPDQELHRWISTWPQDLPRHGSLALQSEDPEALAVVKGCRRIPLRVRYTDRLEILDAWLGEDRFVMDIVPGQQANGRIQFFVHAISKEGAVSQQYDFAASTPLKSILKGKPYRVWTLFRPALPAGTSALHIGVFEADKDGWPRWRFEDGKDHVRIEVGRDH